MIKGLAITPPILGRISIGSVVEKNGKRLPVKEDFFTITSQVQGRNGWVNHPLDEELRKKAGTDKLRSIPVRVLFSAPELNLRAEYSLFDRHTGRPLCVGNGETCRRFTDSGMQNLPCHLRHPWHPTYIIFHRGSSLEIHNTKHGKVKQLSSITMSCRNGMQSVRQDFSDGRWLPWYRKHCLGLPLALFFDPALNLVLLADSAILLI